MAKNNSKESVSRILPFAPFYDNSGPGYPIGTSRPPGTWKPTEIRYYQLDVSDLQFNYTSFGIAQNEDETPILDPRQVVLAAIGNTLELGDLPEPPNAPNIIVENPCFVVVELIGGKFWRFMRDSAGLMTAANHTKDYFELVHYDASANPHAETSPKQDPCRFISFGVTQPRKYTGTDTDNDAFNLYVEADQQNGSKPIALILDPDIKNEGGVNNPSPIGIRKPR